MEDEAKRTKAQDANPPEELATTGPVGEGEEIVEASGKQLSDEETARNDRVMVNVSPQAKKALAAAGYTLEAIAMAPDAELVELKGVTADAVRAIRQRVPYRNGSDS